MDSDRVLRLATRREALQAITAVGGGALFTVLYPERVARAAALAFAQADEVEKRRAEMGAQPIKSQKLADNLTLLTGPGGNVVVVNGPDGKVVVDTFVTPAFPMLKQTLEGIGKEPVKIVVDTHWHFDHTDNNEAFHAAGATLLAHENTKKRMSETHTLAVLNLKFGPSPRAALPQQTFKTTHTLHANGETLAMAHFPPAHTDTDIYVHYQKANVLQTGDVFFNGFYPFIDGGTGGGVKGMIAGLNKILAMVDDSTKIVPGHGPLGNKADVVKFRDMLSTVNDRVEKLRSAGKSVEEAVAAKPFADLDPVWGKGLFTGDGFVRVAYSAP